MNGTLGERAKQAVLWSTGFGLFRDGLQFLVMLIMVRLLDPAAYGQFALAGSIVGVVTLLSFTSYVEHTLQARRDAEVDFQLHFTAGLVFQVAAFAVTNLIALGLRFLPDYADVAPLVHVMSLIFLLTWPHEIRVKMIERAHDWRRLRLLQAAALVGGLGLGLLLALAGAGVYALAAPALMVTVPFIYDLLVAQGWRPDWRWDWQRYRPALRFGLAQIPNALAVRLRPLLENAVIVSALGFASVGFLTRATSLAVLFCIGPAAQLLLAIYPVITRIETGTERYRRMSALVVRGVIWVMLPAATLFAVLAEPVVAVIYGAKWTPVVPLLPWTMLVGVISALQQTLLRLMLAHNQIRTSFMVNLLWFAGIGVCLVVLLRPHGLIPYLAGLCVLQAALAGFMAWSLHRAGGLAYRDLAQALASALAALALALAIVWQGFQLLALDKDTVRGAVLFGSLVGILYLGLLRVLFPRQLHELLTYLPGGGFLLRLGFASPSPRRAR
ncbi:MAG: oligosaccharide flippase family protein [Geminicoccaceae bacterium]|nr:oligosaccharide flippase family protein [Geminicoccaceae bacterium]